jgi:hypothetical protein
MEAEEMVWRESKLRFDTHHLLELWKVDLAIVVLIGEPDHVLNLRVRELLACERRKGGEKAGCDQLDCL